VKYGIFLPGRGMIMTEPQTHSNVETLLWIIVFLGVVGFGSYIVNSISPSTDTVGRVNVIIVLATGLVLIWYTVETKRLRAQAQRQVEEIQQQTEAQLRPFVIVEPTFTEGITHGEFIMRNIGNGTALNIRIWIVRVQYDIKRRQGDNMPTTDNLYMEVNFPDDDLVSLHKQPVSFLPMHQSSNPIELVCTKTTVRSIRPLYPSDPQSIFMIRLHFDNVNGQRYFVEESTRHENLRILQSGRLQGSTGINLIAITHDEVPYLTEKGRQEAQNEYNG
jgi:hypothetical protein